MKKTFAALLAVTLSIMTGYASPCLTIRVSCPNDVGVDRVKVRIFDGNVEVNGGWTDTLGVIVLCGGLTVGETYTVCLDETTLPEGASIRRPCQDITVTSFAPPAIDFIVDGDFCSDETPPPGLCWLTGGGTILKSKGVPNYSFGGVVYPGCSPTAADGGNWNVVDHNTGLHFQGQHIVVDSCSGVSTRSPRVNVNIIDFHGTGIIGGIGGNPEATVAVTFVGRAIDNLEPGGGNDRLFLRVNNGAIVMLQIGTGPDGTVATSTGNLQIHTSSCP